MDRKQARADSYFGWTQGPDDEEAPHHGAGELHRAAGSPSAPPPADKKAVPVGGGRLRLLDDDFDTPSPSPAAKSGARAAPAASTPRLEGLFDLEPPRPVDRAASSGAGRGGGADDGGALDRLSLLDDPADGGEPAEPAAPFADTTRQRVTEEEAASFFDNPLEVTPDPVEASRPALSRLDAVDDEPAAGLGLDNSAISRATAASPEARAPAASEATSVQAGPGAPAAPRRAPPSWEQQKRYERLVALVEEQPEQPDPRIRLATICQEMGKVGEAVKHFHYALRLEPENAFVRARLAELGDAGGVSGPAARESLGARVLASARYPLQSRRGRALLAGGGLMVGACAVAAPFAPIVAWLPLVVAFGGLLTLQHQLVKSGIRGGQEIPDWPESFDAQGAFQRAAAAIGASFALPVVLAVIGAQMIPGGVSAALGAAAEASPYVAYLERMTQSFIEVERLPHPQAAEMARRELLAIGLAEPGASALDDVGFIPIAFLVLGALSFLVGALYYPMALMIAVQLESPRLAFNYPFGAQQAMRAPALYGRLAGVSVGVWLGLVLVAWAGPNVAGALVPLPILGPLAVGALAGGFAVHLLLSLTHLTVGAYRSIEGDLGWFRRSR